MSKIVWTRCGAMSLGLLAALALLVGGCGGKGETPSPSKNAKATSSSESGKKSATAEKSTESAASASTDMSSGEGILGLSKPFSGFAAEGEGQPTEFQADRPATLHFGRESRKLPCTFWIAGEGDTPFLYKIRPGGTGYYDFTFGPDKVPCRFTDAEGRELAALQIKYDTKPEGGNRMRTIYRLTLVKP
jgi:hypothetical protein